MTKMSKRFRGQTELKNFASMFFLSTEREKVLPTPFVDHKISIQTPMENPSPIL